MTESVFLSRAQDEIVDRINNLEDDWMGDRHSTLIHFLDYEHAKPFIKPDVTVEQWTPNLDPIEVGREYLAFAIGKAINHRGLSADRSISHYREWAWLSGDEGFIAALDEDYAPYGVPILKAIATALAAGDVWETHRTPELDQMAAGRPCEPDCEGCTG